MTTALDIISGALRKIGAYQAGDSIDVDDANDALVVLNDLMDSWSNEHLAIFNNVESTFTLQAGVQSYTIGNPSGGTFLGTTVNNSPTISGVTVPANIKAGGTVTGPNIPAGAKVLSFNSGAGTVTLTANATATNSILTPFSYTVPGDVPITRPLRITNAYTRLATSGYSSLDYPCEEISGDQYTSIGLKNQPGPWPKVFYYNTDFPYATIYFWPVPTMNGVFHLWSDMVFSSFANLSDQANLPQGYVRALKTNLALELAPEFGKKISPLLIEQARLAKKALKNTNSTPVSIVTYDSGITGRPKNDAGWILNGGF